MDVMGDKATLFETGRFVQPSSREDTDTPDEAGEIADEAAEELRQRLAAEAGDVEAMSVLGAMLLRRGDLDGAERYLRAATAAGDRAAANNLGVLLHQRGYPDEAAGWWRIAAVAGSAAAAHALGRHLRERGDEPGAEYWLRQSAEQGHALGAYALADLLEHRSDVGAERWLRAPPPNRGTARLPTGWPAPWSARPSRTHEAFGLGRSPVRTGTGLRLPTVAPAPLPAAARAGARWTATARWRVPPRAGSVRPSSGTARPPHAGTGVPPCTSARSWSSAVSSRRPDAGT
ncbi:hypothetical protein SVIOM74S_09760 [Streptomyces violarus]